ncbi:hypothetical protein [Changchengzhania lutea]|uniref:hypothetical protein n=1 Tax=Changchengzhania lutea TaxID=2049305 RepID=UPI00115F1D41|nr:hypothetical protein [Changchengzhania lutea]
MKNYSKEKTTENLKIEDTAAQAQSVTVTAVSGNSISVTFQGIDGNQPNAFGDYLAIWQNGNSIPWTTKPLQTQKIQNTTPTGSANFDNLDVTINSYIVGYAVGPVLTGPGMQPQGNVCASSYIPATGPNAAGSNPDKFVPSLSMNNVGSNSVSVTYKLPSGVATLSNGAWIGIWNSEQAPYKTPPPMAFNKIQTNQSNSTAGINGLNLQRGQTYTIGLFMSGYDDSKPDQTAMACTVTFSV